MKGEIANKMQSWILSILKKSGIRILFTMFIGWFSHGLLYFKFIVSLHILLCLLYCHYTVSSAHTHKKKKKTLNHYFSSSWHSLHWKHPMQKQMPSWQHHCYKKSVVQREACHFMILVMFSWPCFCLLFGCTLLIAHNSYILLWSWACIVEHW